MAALVLPFAPIAACSGLPSTTPAPYDAASVDDTPPDSPDAQDVTTPPDVSSDVATDAPTDTPSDVERWPVACVSQLPNSPPLDPPGSGFVLVADSRSGFSGTQGKCGWRYGYYQPGGPAFVDMPVYEPTFETWFIVPVNASPWTRIGRDLAHPNARASDGTPLEHWIIRRWVSDVEGAVAIGVTTHKADGNDGNGVIVRLVVDGKTIYLQPLARWDTQPRKFVASASVKAGSNVNLVIEPFDGDEVWDHTVALLRVWEMKLRLAFAFALGVIANSSITRAETPGVSWALFNQNHYQRRSAAVWDVDREVVVLFGGSGNHYDHDTGETALHATTLEVGALWRTRHDSTQQPGPRRRMSHAMAYDTSNKRTILYGGDTRFGGYDNIPLTVQLLADTWTWNGTTWSKSCDACGPGPLAGHAMVFDEARGRTVLFGGMPTRYPESVTAATWEHDGTTWSARCGTAGTPACGPIPRAYAGMAYDVARKKTVLFGGRGTKQNDVFGYGVSYDDTWEWDGTSWVARCGTTAGLASCGLGARYEHGMAYHRTRQRTSVVFGVHDEDPDGTGPAAPVSFIHQDVWEWNGLAWSTICGTPARGTCGNLAGRAGAVATYRVLPTPERRYIGLFGGHNLLPSNLVHYWDDATYAVSGSCKADRDCDIGSCVDNVCCQTAACHQCQRCEATNGPLGACVSVKNADHASCSGTCDEASVCRKKQGASACEKSEDCASNACVDNVCCDRPCEGLCEACSIARGADRDGTCASIGAGKAGRASCGAYVCNGRERGCPTQCASNADCVAPRSCIETSPGVRACVLPEPCDGDVLRRGDGTLLDCAPYACAAAGCKASCATIAECSAGNVCRLDHTCGPLATDVDDAGSCRVAAPGLGSGVRVGVLIVMGVWAARRRRKPRA